MLKILSTFIIIISLLSSCVYFNTFYLARKNFDDAEQQRLKNNGVVEANNKKMYDDAIKWSSEILENHKNSRYVDDSLYMIGMSYYYQKEYLKARTKFDELSGAFPESELAPTALYFKAKCLVELDLTDDAITLLLDIVDSKNRSVSGLAGLTIAEISLNNEDWEELLNASQRVIDLNPTPEELVKAMFYKGKALYELERYEECAETLQKLTGANIESELRFNINSLIALSKAKLDRYDEAMTYLESMENRGEFSDYAPRIRLQIGTIYELQENEEMAIDTYRKLAGDFPDSLAAKEAWYNIGKILIQDLSQAGDAKEAFDMVKEGSARTNESWFVEAQIKSVQIDSLIARIERIEELLEENEDTVENQEMDDQEENIEEIQKVDEDVSDVEGDVAEDSGSEENNFSEAMGRTRFSLAELYAYSFERPDSALTQYRLILSESPGTEFAVKSDYFLRMFELQSEGKYSDEAEKKLMMDMIETYTDSEFAQELKVYLGLIENPPEVKAFIEAEHYMLGGQKPEVYIPLYQAVADSFPRTKSAYQARFFIAYAY